MGDLEDILRQLDFGSGGGGVGCAGGGGVGRRRRRDRDCGGFPDLDDALLFAPSGHHLTRRGCVRRRVFTVAAELVPTLVAPEGGSDSIRTQPQDGVAPHSLAVNHAGC